MSAKVLKFEDIEKVDDRPIIAVDVPEWGGTVHLRALSAEEARKFNDVFEGPQKKESAVHLLQKALVHEDGSQMIGPEGLEKLRKKSIKVVMRLAEKAAALNQDAADVEKAKND